jgi:hypothetical protein
MIFEYFRRKTFGKNGVFGSKQIKLCKNLVITSVLEKNAIFSPKIEKNRENFYHNIDPRRAGPLFFDHRKTQGLFW